MLAATRRAFLSSLGKIAEARLERWAACPHLFVAHAPSIAEHVPSQQLHVCELCQEAARDLEAMAVLHNKCAGVLAGTFGVWSGTPERQAALESRTLREAWQVGDGDVRAEAEPHHAMRCFARALRLMWRRVGRRGAGTLPQLLRLVVRDRHVVAHLSALYATELQNVADAPSSVDVSGGGGGVGVGAGVRATAFVADGLSYEEALLARYAYRYAAAAFGVPYERGFFASIEGAMRLQASRDRDLRNPCHQQQLLAIARMLQEADGVARDPLTHLAIGRFAVAAGRPSFFVSCEPWVKTIVIAFRGTTSDGDLVTDLECAPTPFAPSSSSRSRISSGGVVPHGFIDSTSTTPEAAALDAALRELVARHPDFDVLLTGHSLGAAQATLTAARLYRSGIVPLERLAVITFGCPPCGDEAFCAALEREGAHDRFLSLVHSRDCVPRLSERNIARLLDLKPSRVATLSDVYGLAARSAAPEYLIPGRVVLLDTDTGIATAWGTRPSAAPKYAITAPAPRHIPLDRRSALLAVPIPSVESCRDHLLPTHAAILQQIIAGHPLHGLHRGQYGREASAAIVQEYRARSQS